MDINNIKIPEACKKFDRDLEKYINESEYYQNRISRNIKEEDVIHSLLSCFDDIETYSQNKCLDYLYIYFFGEKTWPGHRYNCISSGTLVKILERLRVFDNCSQNYK